MSVPWLLNWSFGLIRLLRFNYLNSNLGTIFQLLNVHLGNCLEESTALQAMTPSPYLYLLWLEFPIFGCQLTAMDNSRRWRILIRRLALLQHKTFGNPSLAYSCRTCRRTRGRVAIHLCLSSGRDKEQWEPEGRGGLSQRTVLPAKHKSFLNSKHFSTFPHPLASVDEPCSSSAV